MKKSDISPEEIFSLLKMANSSAGDEKVKSELLRKTLMDRMTPEQSRQFAQMLGDKGAMESILKSEQARRIMEQFRNNR